MTVETLNKLTHYAQKKGLSVKMGNTSKVSFTGLNTPHTVSININQKTEYAVYDFLHELAHVKIRKNWSRYRSAYPAVGLACEEYMHTGATKYMRRKQYAVETIEEEYEAWRVGLEIAKKHNIYIDRNIYQKYASSNVAKYIKKYNK